MANLRLFANLRETAGTSSAHHPGHTVGEVLDAAVSTYGTDFAAGLTVANVWVNGQVADRSTAVSDDDELAVIPPVSGGSVSGGSVSGGSVSGGSVSGGSVSGGSVSGESTSGQPPTATATDWTDTTPALLGLILLTTFIIANIISLQALAFAAVGGALAWLWDLGDTMALRRVDVPLIPALIATTVAGNAAYRWGGAGLAAGLAAGLVIVLASSLLDEKHRQLESLATAALMALMAGLGAGALILVRIDSPVPVTAFLMIMVLGAVGSWAVQRFASDLGGLDPNLAGAAGVLIGALGIGFLADTLSVVASLIGGAAAVAGWFAGRALGSLLRSGDISHTTRAPGLLTAIDGVVLASAGFWVGLLLFG